jgi:dTDP-4-amino-4,6-dideoxygalactose transaminase
MIRLSAPSIGPEEQQAVAEVMASGQLAQGPRVKAFEEAFAGYIGAREAVAVANGTEALRLALLGLGVGPGDEVVIPAFTFIATATAVLMCDAEPVVVDVEPETFCMDPDAAGAAMGERTKALVPVHLYGHPADLDSLLEVCQERGVSLVEDAAQAHGARHRGRRVGALGTCGCFSFYPTKNMTTGEGGMVTTDDPELAERLRLLRHHGMAGPYEYQMMGYNSRMTDVEAAVGMVQLGKLDGFNEARRRNAAKLTAELGDCVGTPDVAPWAEHVFHQYTVRTPRRDGLRAHLLDSGVQSGVYYPQTLGDIPQLHEKVRVPRGVPEAEAMAREVLSLPVHPMLTQEEIATVSAEVRGFLS